MGGESDTWRLRVIRCRYKQTRDIDPLSIQWWADVTDNGPTVKQNSVAIIRSALGIRIVFARMLAVSTDAAKK